VKLYRNLSGDENVRTATLETITSEELRNFDIVVAGEIVEHLRNPSDFLNQLHQKMYTGQELLITVPNYVSFDSLAAVLNRTESVHPDHEWYFSPFTLSKKFDTRQWNKKVLLPAMYGKIDESYNFVKRSFPGLSDCLIVVVQKI
jgi:2-polyprenyl-3-methyl-5-hydroxy-6-metoxy-1,4-benzoquinol methylase